MDKFYLVSIMEKGKEGKPGKCVETVGYFADEEVRDEVLDGINFDHEKLMIQVAELSVITKPEDYDRAVRLTKGQQVMENLGLTFEDLKCLAVLQEAVEEEQEQRRREDEQRRMEGDEERETTSDEVEDTGKKERKLPKRKK